MTGLSTRDFVRRVLITIGLLLATVAAATLLAQFPTVPLMVFGAVLGAILLNGVARPLARWTGIPRALAVGIVGATTIVALVATFWLSGPRIAEEATQLAERIPQVVESVDERFVEGTWLERLWPGRSGESDHQMLLTFAGRMARSVQSVFSQISLALSGLLAVVVLSFFLAVQPGLYLGGFIRLIPPPKRQRTGEVLDAVARALRWWLVGRFTAMAAVGLLTLVGLVALGIPLALVLSLVVALLSFVPYLGPIVGAVPAVLVGFAESPTTALWVVALYTGVQVVENNLITPLVQMRAVSLPPAVLIVAQLLMGVLFGLLGLLFATPITITVIVLVQALYVQDVLGEPIPLLGENHGRKRRIGARRPTTRRQRAGVGRQAYGSEPSDE